MDEVIRTILGGGVASAVASAIILYVVKPAIATAVTQAANKELERFKSDLTTERERAQQAFARELETHRQLAARDLEQFKAGLTLQAEVRRQVAARKVEAIGRIIAMGDALTLRVGIPSERDTVREGVNAFAEFLRTNAYLFRAEVATKLEAYVVSISARHVTSGSAFAPDLAEVAFRQLREESKAVIELARAELHTEGL